MAPEETAVGGEAMLAKDEDGVTPLHALCANGTALTAELLRLALDKAPGGGEAMLAKDRGARPPPLLLCANKKQSLIHL